MCGRCAAIVAEADVRKLAGAKTFKEVEKYSLKYNCTPQCYLPCIISGTDCTYDAGAFRWGVVPAFASSEKDYRNGPVSTFNARSENLRNSPLWRRLLQKRCIVVVQGYYEWRTDPSNAKTKTPFFIHHASKLPYECLDISLAGENWQEKMPEVCQNAMRLADVFGNTGTDCTLPEDMHRSGCGCGNQASHKSYPDGEEVNRANDLQNSEDTGQPTRPLLIAGLYDEWRSGETLRTCAILTMSSTGLITESIHDRAPVLLDQESARLWLSKTEFNQVFPAVVTTATRVGAKDVSYYEVPSLVSNIKNEHPDCIMPQADYNARQLDIGLARFGGAVRRVTKRKRTVNSSPPETTIWSKGDAAS